MTLILNAGAEALANSQTRVMLNASVWVGKGFREIAEPFN